MQKLVLAVLVLAALFALSHAAARQISVNKSRVLSLHNGERKLKRVAGLRWSTSPPRLPFMLCILVEELRARSPLWSSL